MKKNVYLIGRTNVGKTSLFNELTGSKKKVANYHGATTFLAKADLKNSNSIRLFDLPGTYSLTEESLDETLTLETLNESSSESLWLLVLDAVELKTGIEDLKKLLQKFSKRSARLLIAINMIDEAKYNNIKIDWRELKSLSEVTFIPVSAKKKTNIDKLNEAIIDSFNYKDKAFSKALSEIEQLNTDTLIDNPENQVALKRVETLDKIFLSKFFGPFLFFMIMLFLFQSVFTWAGPFMDLIESSLSMLGAFVSSFISNNFVKSFFEDAIFGGLGSFLVFVPQIFILAFLITTLEDSGYLSRASLICNRFLSFFGLSGESFIPLLTSHACAIPGIYATRSIKAKRVRILTLLTLPLTVCSARLPVYALLISLTVPPIYILGGLFGARGFGLFLTYIFGILLSLVVSAILAKTNKEFKKKKGDSVIQLTRYKMPDFKKSLNSGLSMAYHFVKDAGLIIFITNAVIWILGAFPNGPGDLKNSYLSSIGKTVHFVFEPLGMNWQESVAVLTSFLARETFVGTLGTLYNLDTEEVAPLAKLMEVDQNPNQLASALALIVFFAIALQCVSTVALLKTELPNKSWSIYLFGAYFALAYTLSFITYRVALFF